MANCSWVDEASGIVYVKFDRAPVDSVRKSLKAAGFKWDGRARQWSAPYNQETIGAASRAVPGACALAAPQAPAADQLQPGSHPEVDLAAQGSVKQAIAKEGFDFGIATPEQKKAITTTEGPLLITAGPGTGKTATLVARAMYLIQACGVKPSEIMIVTYTEKAAKELLDRLAKEADKRGVDINFQDMYLGTFHSICLRLLKENIEYSSLPNNFGVTDAFEQKYMVFREIKQFRDIPGIDALGSWNSRKYPDYWRLASDIVDRADNLIEERVPLADLSADEDDSLAAHGKAASKYFELIKSRNKLDFAMLQRFAYNLLKSNPEVLGRVREQVRYIMVDEYQDTNHIQEQLAFLIAGGNGNICVVGDDDQSLYRFRGATVRNILEFNERVIEECAQGAHVAVVNLETNFRSNPEIVDFFGKWMEDSTKTAAAHAFDWESCRLPKAISAFDEPRTPWPSDGKAVVKLTYDGGDRSDWHRKIQQLILGLKRTGKITDYNQVAVLFASVAAPTFRTEERANPPLLASYLEAGGPEGKDKISVYSPRSGSFYQRSEVRYALGALMGTLPHFADADECPQYWQKDTFTYLKECWALVEEMFVAGEWVDLRNWIAHTLAENRDLVQKGINADYAFAELVYRMFAFQPFSTILDIDASGGAYDTRPLHNLSLLVSVLVGFQEEYNIQVLSGKWLERNTQSLCRYLGKMRSERIDEHEDEIQALPSGCVSFLTMHQSKGMEFPVVIVDTSEGAPWGGQDEAMQTIIEKYGSGLGKEPPEKMAQFDFWRKYYVAFSRAQDLLVLTNGAPTEKMDDCFQWIYDGLDEVDPTDYSNPQWCFHEVKDATLRQAYSFTSHVNVYDTCPRQYKFQKELGFPGVRTAATLFGSTVHQTIEDVHKAVLRNEEHLITDKNIETWFAANYTSLSTLQKEYLQKSQQEAALAQVKRYVARRKGDWSDIRKAEVKVDLVGSDYIITGNVDLIQGENDTVELVDFKSESPTKLTADPERAERYRKQLRLYAHLVEESDPDVKVGALHLYCTGAKDGEDPWVSEPRDDKSIEDVVESFDATVRKIQTKDFNGCAKDKKTCNECDFRWYCKTVG